MREALPARIARVAAALAEWREAEGAPFLYDGRDYEVGPGGCVGVCMWVWGAVRVGERLKGSALSAGVQGEAGEDVSMQ
jgi:hypothetical protein